MEGSTHAVFLDVGYLHDVWSGLALLRNGHSRVRFFAKRKSDVVDVMKCDPLYVEDSHHSQEKWEGGDAVEESCGICTNFP
jgi:hypothetical protein